MASNELLSSTISQLAPRIRAGEVSPVDLTEAALSRARAMQPTLNSFITLLEEQAMAQAREEEAAIARGEYKGPLQGIPIGIKDNLATAGIRTTLGTKVLSDNVPEEDCEAVRRCRAAGAVILGKENLEEFAAGATSNNPHFGAVRNPWGTDHVPGGSSGGGGANVAAEVTFASLGTDLGGSVRLPGAFCGVVGLKQTFGRVSQRGLLVTSFNGDHIGPMTRSVADSAILLQAIAGHDPLDPSTVPVPVPDYSAGPSTVESRGLRIGRAFQLLLRGPGARGGGSDANRAVAALEELGAISVPIELPDDEVHRGGADGRYVGRHSHARALPAGQPGGLRSGHVLYRTLGGQFVMGHHYSKAMKAQRLIQEDYARVLQGCGLHRNPDHAAGGAAHRRRSTWSTTGRPTGCAGPGSGHGLAQHQSFQRHRDTRRSRCPAA